MKMKRNEDLESTLRILLADLLMGRIGAALEVALKYGATDGAHHKMWVIDQMVRSLTNCPNEHDKSPEYEAFLDNFIEDDEGEEVCYWDTGIAP